MRLEIYLGEQLLDSVSVFPYPSASFSKQLKSLKEELLKKHACVLSKDESKPVFMLSGVPSCINDFVPLGRA